ncbi:unnamed protein product [Caenorhabditis auriculariae]|uniref:BRCT domain-containing protein n=1 Tax=Caenorhabditis auriculariae TaxID=2777116 RepID=A0A8S1GPM6_9PELO|nr:unnamed protein product [Caenorhabditis auriculariae]
MSIAHDFPDITLSPIRSEPEANSFSVHFTSSLETDGKSKSKPPQVVVDKTLGTTSINEEDSEENDANREISRRQQSQRPAAPLGDVSELFRTIDVLADTVELVIPLRGAKVVVNVGCCEEARQEVCDKLEEMGAAVVDDVTSSTTHCVVDSRASLEVVERVLQARQAVFLVDVHWVQKCYEKKEKVSEEEFSMYDCRYLRKKLRRVSSVLSIREYSEEYVSDNENDENASPGAQVGTGESLMQRSMTAEELLGKKSRQFPEKLDELAKEYRLQPLSALRGFHHCTDCPNHTVHSITVAEEEPTNGPSRPIPKWRAKLGPNTFKNPKSLVILRRRSHDGFVLEHRNPEDISVPINKASHDVREVLRPAKRPRKAPQKKQMPPIDAINDMRRVTSTDLNQIRTTLKKNAAISKSRTGKGKKNYHVETVSESQRHFGTDLINVSEDAELESALASLRLRADSPQSHTSSSATTGRAPLFPTRSSFINRLQCVSTGEGFVEVSPIRNQVVKNAVVLSGFNKRYATFYRELAELWNLTIATETGPTTKCVVSRAGERTLTVLQAVCRGIPVVKPAWLEDCVENECLLPIREYFYEKWSNLLAKRKVYSRIFENMGKIFVADGCSPPSDQIRWIIRSSGGRITYTIEKASIIVVPDNYPPIVSDSQWLVLPPIVSPLFIIDSVTHNELMMFADYLEQTLEIPSPRP